MHSTTNQKYCFKETDDLFSDASPVLLIIQFKWGVGGLVYSLIISTNQAINALARGRLGYLTNPLPPCHSVPFLLTEKQGTTTMDKKSDKTNWNNKGWKGEGGEVQMWFISPEENTTKSGKQRKQGDWSTLGSFTSSKASWSTADRVKRHRHKSRTTVFKLQVQS